jgi:hypothetical protein
MAITWEPYFLTLLWIDFAVCAFIYLITWRIARRFGWRGLAVVVIAAAIIGPPRDYWYMARFPEWGAYGPGVARVLAIAATYVVMVVLGHGVMRLVAGPAQGSPFALGLRCAAWLRHERSANQTDLCDDKNNPSAGRVSTTKPTLIGPAR